VLKSGGTGEKKKGRGDNESGVHPSILLIFQKRVGKRSQQHGEETTLKEIKEL